MRNLMSCLFIGIVSFFSASVLAEPMVPMRVGVLEFGTVNWELEVIRSQELAKKRGIDLKIVPLASGDASAIALQGDAVDIIVTDWIWVSRQRAEGNTYTFAPFSNVVGSVMVRPDSGIRKLTDLKDRKMGVAGGPSDKSWLLLRAYAQSKYGVDLTKFSQPTYAAPPLLNELAKRGQVDAVLNHWNYAARLEVLGMQNLISVPEILKGLGIDKPIPILGWVFREDWALAHREAVRNFLAASYEAKAMLATTEAPWNIIRPKMHAENDTVFRALQSNFRAGISMCADPDSLAAVADTFKILADAGGEKLVGKSKTLTPGTFWSGFALPECKTH